MQGSLHKRGLTSSSLPHVIVYCEVKRKYQDLRYSNNFGTKVLFPEDISDKPRYTYNLVAFSNLTSVKFLGEFGMRIYTPYNDLGVPETNVKIFEAQ